MEYIYGTKQDCAWELCVNTLKAFVRNLFSWIKDFASGFYWQVIQEHSLRTLYEILGTILSGFCLNYMRSKVSVKVFFCVFPVTDFNLCNLEPIATA